MEGTILFVDDDPLVLSIIRRSLIDTPYKGLFTSSSTDALDILNEEEVDVIVTNLRMPKIDGVELLKSVRAEFPFVTRVVLTGYLQVHSIMAAINHGEVFRFLTKPLPVHGHFMKVLEDAVQYSKTLKEKYSVMLSIIQDVFNSIQYEFICVDEHYNVLEKSPTITEYEKGENLYSDVVFLDDDDSVDRKKTVHLAALGPMTSIGNTNHYGQIYFFFRELSFRQVLQ